MKKTRNIGGSSGIYRRRRTFAAAGAAVLFFSVYQVAGAGAESEPEFYTVQPGDTIWSLASDRTGVTEDARVAVEEIRATNDLSGYEIRSGQILKLPT